MNLLELGSITMGGREDSAVSGNYKNLIAFQWGGTISAIFLLILNRTGKRSSKQTSLLVLFLLISFPTPLFKILQGELGCWIAFLAVVGHLFFPKDFPVSRFVIFVITPDWIADGLRDNIVGGYFCLVIGLLLIIMEMRGNGICSSCGCNLHCLGYCLAVFFLFFYTILYAMDQSVTQNVKMMMTK